MLKFRMLLRFSGALASAVLATGVVHAEQTPSSGAVPTTQAALSKGSSKPHKPVHSPYARAAAAHATQPTPGHPIKGHSATAVQGQGLSSLHKHSAGRPH